MTESHHSDNGPERYLRVDHLTEDLRGRSIRGGAVTLANQGAKLAINFAAMIILARLLTPDDFGVIAAVMPIIILVSIFKDMGLAMATVQREEINHGQVSTLFWINLAVSAVVMLLTAALAPLTGMWYDDPRVTQVTLALALTIPFSGLGVQHLALLRRQMRFAPLARTEVAALIIGAVAAIAVAIQTRSYWALVVLPLVREVAFTVGLWVVCGWRPGAPVRRSGVRVMLSFGAHLTAFNFVNFFARNVDRILIGRFDGSAALGLYDTAYRLVLMPIQQINTPLSMVAVPTLARLQNQWERFRAYYRRGLMLIVSAGMPLVVYMFVDAPLIIPTLLDEQWIDAIPICRALAPAAWFATFNVATGWVFISLGRTRQQLSWGIFVSLLTVGAFIIGLRWGSIGVAAAISIVTAVTRVPAMVYAFRGTEMKLRDPFIAIWRPAIASVAAGAGLYYINATWASTMPGLARVVIDFAVYALLYILIWVALPRGRQSLRELLHIARELRPGGPERAAPGTDPATPGDTK